MVKRRATLAIDPQPQSTPRSQRTKMGIKHAKGKENEWWVVVFTPADPYVTVIANGFQPYSHAKCHESGCIICWFMQCELGVRSSKLEGAVCGAGGPNPRPLPAPVELCKSTHSVPLQSSRVQKHQCEAGEH